MSFNYPGAFFLLLTIPFLYILRKIHVFKPLSIVLTFSDWKGRRFNWQNTSINIGDIVSKVLFIISYLLIIIAIADPVIIHSEKEYTSRGSEIIFVIDVSPSMAALDMDSNTRLSAAKAAIQYLVSKNDGVGYGIIACGLEAALVLPPTIDYNTFLERLNSLSIGELGDGSAIGTGLATAVYHLISSKSPSKSIVLLTDGENNAGSVHPLIGAELAAENNIKVFVAGIGTKGSVAVKYADPETGKVYSGYLESNFDDSSLREIATTGNGTYYTVQTLDSLKTVLKTITDKNSTFQTYQIKQTRVNYYRYILIASMNVLALAWLIRRVFMKQVL